MEQIRLDLIPNGVMPNVHASQFDNGRTIRFNLYEGESPFSLLATDYVKVACNNNISVSTANIGNSHDWTIPDSVVADSGVFIGELTIERDSVIVGSKNFVLNVEEDAYNGKNLEERTASGTIANFETNLQDNLTACKCEINALQSGTGTPSPNNPRPISGFNGATIVRCGVNLLNAKNFVQRSGYTNLSASISGSDISIVGYTSGGRFACFYALTEIGKTYTVKFTNSTGVVDCRVQFSDTEPTEWISGGTTFFANKTLTFTSTKTWCMLWFELNADATITELQLEQGSTATAYKPYNGSQYAPYFEGLLNGSYGFVDLGTLSWSYITSGAVPRFQAELSPSGSGCADNTKIANAICSLYPVASWANVTNLISYDKNIAEVSGGGYLAVQNSDYTDATAFTNAMDGVYLIYELATPITPTITQSQIDTLIRAFGDTCVCVVFGLNISNGLAFAQLFSSGVSDYSLDTTNKTVTFSHTSTTGADKVLISGGFKANTVYTFEGYYTAAARNTSLRFIYTDGTNSYVDFTATNTKTKIVVSSTSGKTVDRIVLGYWGAGVVTLYYDESSVYEGTLGNLVYEGMLDVTNGKLIATHKIYAFDGTEALNGMSYERCSFFGLTDAYYTSDTHYNSLYCSHYQSKGEGDSSPSDFFVYKSSMNVAVVFRDSVNCPDITTFKNYLATQYNNGTPVTLVYELATPTEITLTPKQIEAIVGINNVYHDCNGQTEVKYLVEV